jgi:hypothetical protein
MDSLITAAAQALACVRCVVAEAEIALVSRDLSWQAKALDTARATLEAHGDRPNAAPAQYLEIRRLLLTGGVNEAEELLSRLDPPLFSHPHYKPRMNWESLGSRSRGWVRGWLAMRSSPSYPRRK